jgi:hypothetical protein
MEEVVEAIPPKGSPNPPEKRLLSGAYGKKTTQESLLNCIQ